MEYKYIEKRTKDKYGSKIYTLKGRYIGSVYFQDDLWGYNCLRMEKKSGGLEGHWGMDSKSETIQWLMETDQEYK